MLTVCTSQWFAPLIILKNARAHNRRARRHQLAPGIISAMLHCRWSSRRIKRGEHLGASLFDPLPFCATAGPRSEHAPQAADFDCSSCSRKRLTAEEFSARMMDAYRKANKPLRCKQCVAAATAAEQEAAAMNAAARPTDSEGTAVCSACKKEMPMAAFNRNQVRQGRCVHFVPAPLRASYRAFFFSWRKGRRSRSAVRVSPTPRRQRRTSWNSGRSESLRRLGSGSSSQRPLDRQGTSWKLQRLSQH